MEIIGGLFVFGLLLFGVYKFVNREKKSGESKPRGTAKESQEK